MKIIQECRVIEVGRIIGGTTGAVTLNGAGSNCVRIAGLNDEQLREFGKLFDQQVSVTIEVTQPAVMS